MKYIRRIIARYKLRRKLARREDISRRGSSYYQVKW